MTSKSEVLAKVDLDLGNRDGYLYAVRAGDGKCYLVLEAESFCKDEVFSEMGSTEDVEISRAAFEALTQTN